MVVQAKAFSKYLGYINITWDDSGAITAHQGDPILLDGSIPQGEISLYKNYGIDTMAPTRKNKA